MGLLGSECSCGHLVRTALTPQLPSLLEFAVSLRPDLGGLAIHEVQRRNVADRAVQANPVVIFDESFHQAASLFEARGAGRTQGVRFYRLVPTLDLPVRLRVVRRGTIATKTQLPVQQIVQWCGVARGKFYDWRKRYGKVNEHNGLAIALSRARGA